MIEAKDPAAPPEDYEPLEEREFEVEASANIYTDQAALDRAMAAEGYIRISGNNYDDPSKARAWGWKDLDGDGEVG